MSFDPLPTIWINDKNDKLLEASTNALPNTTGYTICDRNNICLTTEAHSFLADMNNDGIVDLVQWHTGTPTPDLRQYM